MISTRSSLHVFATFSSQMRLVCHSFGSCFGIILYMQCNQSTIRIIFIKELFIYLSIYIIIYLIIRSCKGFRFCVTKCLDEIFPSAPLFQHHILSLSDHFLSIVTIYFRVPWWQFSTMSLIIVWLVCCWCFFCFICLYS